VHIYCGDGRAATGTPTLFGLTANVTDSEYFHILKWTPELGPGIGEVKV
jgi:hypothetical protein